MTAKIQLMGKYKDITIEDKRAIAALIKGGKHTNFQIAIDCGVSRNTVQRVKKAMLTDGLQSGRIGKCGRKRKTSGYTDRQIKRASLLNPFLTPHQHVKKLEDAGIQVSHMTIRRRLKEQGFQNIRPLKKPRLTAAMRQKRFNWARQHAVWTIDDWKKVCFSDESSFQCQDASQPLVWHKVGRPYPTVPTVKFPTKVMVWSAMCYKGTGRLHIVEGNMNSKNYIEVLKDRLVPQLNQWYPDGDAIFMQDGAPCHTAKNSISFLESKGIQLLNWPGNSPDLNPIETLWAIIKRRLKGKTIKTKKEMITALIQAWFRDESVADTCNKLINTMPDRVRAVIAAKGGHTMY